MMASTICDRNCFFVAVLIAALVLSPGRSREVSRGPQSNRPVAAYAFLRDGDIWLRYKGEAHAVTKKGSYKDFAVTDDGSRIALLRPSKKDPSQADIEVVDLGNSVSQSAVEVSITTAVVATCGTLASIENNVALARRVAIAKELISRTEFADREYADFRCNKDRRVVIGYKNLLDRYVRLREGGRPEKQAAVEDVPSYLDVSPSGEFVSFYTGKPAPSTLCVWKTREEAKCMLYEGVFNRLSVSDSGELVFATQSGEECLFKDGEHYSTTPKRGYDSAGVCPGVGYWRPGTDSIDILESPGGHPQWLTDAAAFRLAGWNAKGF
jgi:hypothetical protein